MWKITEFCFNLQKNHYWILITIPTIIFITQLILTSLNLYPGNYFLLLYIPTNIINILSIFRQTRYGYKPLLQISEEEIILNELTGENDWDKISSDYALTEDFMLKYKKHLNWNLIIIYQKLRVKFIEKMWDYIKTNPCMLYLSLYDKPSKKFIEKHKSDFQNFFKEKDP